MNQSIYLIVIPLLFAFISIMFKKISRELLLTAVVINIVLAILNEPGQYLLGGYQAPYGIVLNIDYYAIYSVLLLNVLFGILVWLHMNRVKKLSVILLVSLASLNGMLLTGDLFNLFVFMEIASISAFMIVSTNKKLVHVFNYMIVALFGGSMYLFGVVLLYSQFGTINMDVMKSSMEVGGVGAIAVIFIFVGFGIEMKLLPLNGWVKGILKHSDGFTGPMIASIYSGVMLLVFGRLMNDVLVIDTDLRLLFSLIAVLTIILGEASAFSTMNIRELLLYSSVAQSGLAALLFINGLVGVAALVVVGNMLAKFVLFLLAGTMSDSLGNQSLELRQVGEPEIEKTLDILKLKGIFKKNPINGIAFSIASLSLVGLPLFFGFFVKMNVLYHLMQSENNG